MSYKSLNLLLLSLFILAACGGGGGGSGYSSTTSTSTGCSPSATNLCITVQEASSGAYGSTSRKYVVQNSSSAGVAQKTLTLNAGTYVFDQTGSSNATHPLRISTTNNGTHASGSAYTTGVTVSGTPGTDGKTTIVINSSTPTTLYYYCSSHSGMGGTINIVLGESSSQVEFTETN
jgi:hypothetical protein